MFQGEKARQKRYGELVSQGRVKEAEETLHKLHHGTYVGDLVYGANDGIVTTFAVVAAAAGGELSSLVVLVLGVANLIADGFSMGASNFLALRSQNEFVAVQKRRVRWAVGRHPEVKRAKVAELLGGWGFVKKDARAVTKNRDRWTRFLLREELGLKEPSGDAEWRHGLATFAAFVVAGAVPLVPYVVGLPEELRFPVAAFFAALAFFVVGAARTLVTAEHPLRAGLEILLVGGVASGVAYTLGWAVRSALNVSL